MPARFAAVRAMPDGLVGSVFSNAGTVVVGSAFSKVCLIAVELSLAASLGAAGYGLFSIAFALMLVTSTLTLAGFNFGIIQYLGVYTEQGDMTARRSVARVSLLLVLAVSGIAGTGIGLSADRLATSVFGKPELAPLLLIIGLVVPFEGLNQCLSAVFRGLRLYRYHIIALDLVRNVSMLACIPFAMLDRLTLETALYIVAIGTTIGTMIGLALLSRQLDLLKGFDRDPKVFREILSFSYPLSLWQLLQKSANRLMLVIAGALLTSSNVGVLAVALRFSNALTFAQTAFNTTTPVEFARLHHLEDRIGMNRLLQVVALTLMIVSLALALPLLLNAGAVMAAFGADYAPYGWVLIPLLLAKIVDVGTGPAGHVLVACRRRKTVLGISAADAGLQFLLVVPLIAAFGLAGAVYGDSLRIVATVALRHLALRRLVGVHAITWTLARVSTCALVLGAGAAVLIALLGGVVWRIALTGLALFTTGALIFRILHGRHTTESFPHSALPRGLRRLRIQMTGSSRAP